MRVWWLLLLVGVVGCAAERSKPQVAQPGAGSKAMVGAACEPANAEYAVRWDITAGGPKTAEKVLAALDLAPKKDKDSGKPKEKKFTVEYFDVTSPKSPEGFKRILRRRTDKKGSELTFKFRGDKAIATPACPLAAGKSKEPEIDVTFAGASETSSAYSYSCDKETNELPENLGPKPVGCRAAMRRLEADFACDELKVEEWTVKKARYIEVSFSSKTGDPHEKIFRKDVVARLVEKGIHPLQEGMTTITTECTDSNE